MKVEIKCILNKGAIIPKYQTSGSSGADIHAFLDKTIVIKPNQRKLIPTGIKMEIPVGWEVQIRPRSGLAIKHGITVLNSPGTIDSDYRGDVSVILINLGSKKFLVKNGDRIAQMIVSKTNKANFIQTNNINITERGEGGFGSTGLANEKNTF